MSIVFIMLNPSTADATTDDPTIRKCMKFAQRLGYDTHTKAADIDGWYRYSLTRGDMKVVNLFAYRATDPDELPHVTNPVGPRNDAAISQILEYGHLVICGWGRLDVRLKWREKQMCDLLRSGYRGAYHKLKCLRLNNDGSPGHPLYLRDDSPLLEFRP